MTDNREISARRADRAPDFYQVYLNSSDWRVTRNRALQRANYACQRCGVARRLEVHHRTYARLGRELDSDLEVVCFGCHTAHHAESQTGGADVYVRLASEAVQITPFASFSDIADVVKRLCVARRIPQRVDRIDRAIGLVCETRLRNRSMPAVSVVEAPVEQPLTAAQATELLARIRAKTGLAGAVKVIRPALPPLTARDRAMQMVVMEIESAVERCSALERNAVQVQKARVIA